MPKGTEKSVNDYKERELKFLSKLEPKTLKNLRPSYEKAVKKKSDNLRRGRLAAIDSLMIGEPQRRGPKLKSDAALSKSGIRWRLKHGIAYVPPTAVVPAAEASAAAELTYDASKLVRGAPVLQYSFDYRSFTERFDVETEGGEPVEPAAKRPKPELHAREVDSVEALRTDFEKISDLQAGGQSTIEHGTIAGKTGEFCIATMTLASSDAVTAVRERLLIQVQLSEERPDLFVEIIKFSCVEADDNSMVSFLMPFMPGNTLRHFLKALHRANASTSDITQTIAIRLLACLEVMQEAKILHRDITPANCLLDANNDLHLADFGLSERYVEWLMVDPGGGTPRFYAPEVYTGVLAENSDFPATALTILWALAGGIFQLEYDTAMWRATKNGAADVAAAAQQVIVELNYGGVPPKELQRDDISEEWKSLIKSMLAFLPSHRPSIETLKIHPAITNSVEFSVRNFDIDAFVCDKKKDAMVEFVVSFDVGGGMQSQCFAQMDLADDGKFEESLAEIVNAVKLCGGSASPAVIESRLRTFRQFSSLVRKARRNRRPTAHETQEADDDGMYLRSLFLRNLLEDGAISAEESDELINNAKHEGLFRASKKTKEELGKLRAAAKAAEDPEGAEEFSGCVEQESEEAALPGTSAMSAGERDSGKDV